MSYGINVKFRYFPGKSKAQLIERAHSLVQEFGKQPNFLKNFLKENEYYVPSLRYMLADKDELYRLGAEIDRFWLKDALSMEVLIWPRYHLIGVIGDWTGTKMEKFHSIYFQNSCDQDYSFDTWKDVCPMFDKTVRKWKDSNPTQMEKMYKDWFDGEKPKTEEKWEYCRRVAAYSEIIDRLQLKDFMYSDGRVRARSAPYFDFTYLKIPIIIPRAEWILRAFVKEKSEDDFRLKHKTFYVHGEAPGLLHVLSLWYPWDGDTPTQETLEKAVSDVAAKMLPKDSLDLDFTEKVEKLCQMKKDFKAQAFVALSDAGLGIENDEVLI